MKTPPQKQKNQQNRIKTPLKRCLKEFAKKVDPCYEYLDEEVEEILLNYADKFMESVMNGACLLALHRKSNRVETQDVLTHLDIRVITRNTSPRLYMRPIVNTQNSNSDVDVVSSDSDS